MDTQADALKKHPDVAMQRYCLSVGYNNGVKPGNIVGMIINEADIEKDYVGHIEIYDDVCTVDLPADMPEELMKQLSSAFICGKSSELQSIKEGQTRSEGRKFGGKRKSTGDKKHSRKRKPKN